MKGERGNPFLRRADRWIGIPAIAAIGAIRSLRRRSRTAPKHPRVIGLLKASGIGDAVILSPVIADIRARFPNARIVLFAGPSNFAFARLFEGADEVVRLPVMRPHVAVALVRERKPDVMIDFGMWPRFEAMVAALSGATWVAGVRTPGQHRHFAYDAVVDHSTDHEIINYRNLAALLGVRSTGTPSLHVRADTGSPLARPYAVFHLWPGGANSAERSWPIERWHALGKALTERGYAIVLTGSRQDAEPSRRLIESWSGVDALTIAGLTPEESLRWLRYARGTISVNTGIVHVSAALGTPTIALNGPTSSRRWGPLGKHTRNVNSPMIPGGYLNLGLERNDRYADCMKAIETSTVLAAWDDVLAEADAATLVTPLVTLSEVEAPIFAIDSE